MSRGPARRFAVDATALGTGTVLAAAGSYVFVSIGTRSLGAAGFAPISMLWSFWAICVAAVTFPVTHWAIRTVEAHGEGHLKRSISSVWVMATIVAVALGLVSWWGRETLFHDRSVVYPVVAAILPVGAAFMGLARGVLSARRRFAAVASSLAGENAVRVLAGAALIGFGAPGLAVALLMGFLVVLFFRDAFRLDDVVVGTAGPRPALLFLGAAASGSMMGQAILTGGTVALAVIGGSAPEITGLFAALTLFRSPYMVAMGVSARLSAGLTRAYLETGTGRVYRLAVGVLLVTVGGAAAAWWIGGSLGDDLLRLIFGSDVRLGATGLSAIASGSVLALSALFSTLALIASDRSTAVTRGWAIAGLTYLAVLALGPGEPVVRAALAFLVAEAVAAVVLTVFISERWSGGRST